MLRPVEGHVLDEVGDALLVVVLEGRTRAHDEPEEHAIRGLGVSRHAPGQPVRERPRKDGGIGNERGRRLIGRRRPGRGGRRGRVDEAGEGRDEGDGKQGHGRFFEDVHVSLQVRVKPASGAEGFTPRSAKR